MVADMEMVPLREEDFTPLLPTPLKVRRLYEVVLNKKSHEIPVETGLGVTSLLTHCISFFHHVACLVGS